MRGTKSELSGSVDGVGVKIVGGSSDPLLSNSSFMIDSVRTGRLLLAGGGLVVLMLVVCLLRENVEEGVRALE